MSEQNTRELMTKYFPECPICKKQTKYNVNTSNHIVQCDNCKSEFFSTDFLDIQKGLTHLGLTSLPTSKIAGMDLGILTAYKNQMMPIVFWQNLQSVKQPKIGVTCECGGTMISRGPITFRTGEHSEEGQIAEFIAGTEIGLTDHLTEDTLTLDMYVCERCKRVAFRLPEIKSSPKG